MSNEIQVQGNATGNFIFGFLTVLTVLLTVAKGAGITPFATMSWGMIFLPMLVYIGIIVVMLVIIFAILLVAYFADRK